ncbi:uncharacterized protein [Asterias amurensis]|uniref:uncharacterized protein isoform X2 n=1 Tax=Asterias amurensis TaxID=7602 RepID=UPI003AB735A7
MLSRHVGDNFVHGQQARHNGTGPLSSTAASSGMSPYTRPAHRQQQQSGLRSAGSSKIDPSFKSKRYRDKLREQIKALENLLPIDKATLHRKLDSQTVFRLVISYFRTKIFFQVAGFSAVSQGHDSDLHCQQTSSGRDTRKPIAAKREHLTADAACKEFCNRSEVQLALESLDGFLLVVTSDGTILYSTENISSHLGFHQVDLVHRCLYGIIHPDDHHELKVVLEQTLVPTSCHSHSQLDMAYGVNCGVDEQGTSDSSKVSFLCRMKCFNGTSTGFVKMHCCGTMRSFPGAIKSSRTSCQVLFLAFRPFASLAQDTDIEFKQNIFWSKHEMDLRVKLLDTRANDILGFDPSELEGRSLYELIHPNDLAAMYTCHKTLMDTDENHTLYFRLIKKDLSWVWLHTRAKVMVKNSRKNCIIFTHCPVRETDSSYLQQEARARARYGLDEYLKMRHQGQSGVEGEPSTSSPQQTDCNQTKRRWTSNDTYVVASQSPYKLKDDYSASLHSPHGACPSSYHQSSDRHSPVYPSTYAPHRYQKATQGIHSTLEKVSHEREAPPMNVNFYDYAHTSEDFLHTAPLHPNPQPHPALSMYQMVAHLPPEMYDVDSYRKHALMFMENPHQMTGGGMVSGYHHHLSQYQLPLTPQTSPQSFYPQGHYASHYPDHLTPGHTSAPETLSPPPSPTRSFKSAACMYSNTCTQMDGCNKGPDSLHQGDCCKTEHYASYVVNGAMQLKLLDSLSYPRTQYPNGYSHEYPHGDQYTSEHSYTYANQYEPEVELKPFQRMDSSVPHKMTSALCSPTSYPESPMGINTHDRDILCDRVFHDRERFLPCALANTRNGCLAPKLPLTNEVRIISPVSSLPPIGSFLDFLNEDAPPAEESC